MQEQTQTPIEQLQAENVRLKAELYDMRNSSETQINTLQQAVIAIANIAEVKPDETGNINLQAVVSAVAEKLAPADEVKPAAKRSRKKATTE